MARELTEEEIIKDGVYRMMGAIGGDIEPGLIDPEDLADLATTYYNYGGKEFEAAFKADWQKAGDRVAKLFPKGYRL